MVGFSRLEDRQALLNAIIMSSDDAIVSKSLDGIITSWNPAAEYIFGYNEYEAVGKHISLIIPTDRLEEEDFIIGQIKSGNKVDHFETVRKKKNGDLFPISVTVSPVINDEGKIIGASKIARDIGDRYKLQLEKAELLEKLKDLNAKKDEFIALASHELRTPLSSMRAFLQIMARYINDEKANQFLQKALLQADKLNVLIADLLDVSKIESGKLALKAEQFDVRHLIEEVIQLTAHVYTNFEITLHTEIDQQIMYGDPARIEQVITNLLSNAIRYSSEDRRITVLLGMEDHHVKVGVKDYGLGIASDKVEHIFSRFYRADEKNTAPGLGLGLYLSAEIVAQHQGKIWVESELGKGSTFWVLLPV